MTRKDYVAIADALRNVKPTASHVWELQWKSDRVALANVFAADNPRFDRDRFYKACNPE